MKQSGQLEKKLAAYTIAGAAALVAPGVAKADIVYVPVNTTVNQSSVPNNLTFPFANDITLTAQPNTGFTGDPTNEVDATTGTGAQVLLSTPSNDVAALAFGSMIDPNNPQTNTQWGSGGKLVGVDAGIGPDSGGFFSNNGGTGYLGFYFGAPGSPQAGWAEVATTASKTGSSFTLIGYAYDTVANEAITVGQGAPTPEPSALPLLVLGGAGLIELRRRRAARN